VMAAFTAGISNNKLKALGDATELITFFDYGKGGEMARSKIRKSLKGIPIVDVLPEKEEKDPGALTAEEIWYHLSPHINL
jgi:hypothetical protein